MSTKTESRSDKLRAAHDKLQQAVAEIASGDDWQRMLKVASKFHRYSFNNHQVEPHSIGPPSSAAISCGDGQVRVPIWIVLTTARDGEPRYGLRLRVYRSRPARKSFRGHS